MLVFSECDCIGLEIVLDGRFYKSTNQTKPNQTIASKQFQVDRFHYKMLGPATVFSTTHKPEKD